MIISSHGYKQANATHQHQSNGLYMGYNCTGFMVLNK